MEVVSGGNKTFRILSCIGILLILLGHLDFNILEFGGLFPYYSYHVMIFVFIAGYFYKTKDEDAILSFIIRKMRKLMLPYLALNLIFGLITAMLARQGFFFGQEFNLRTMFFEPINGGHHFMLIAPGWFIPALFLFEICNVCGRRVLRLFKIENEYIIMALYLIVGIMCIYLSKRGSVYDYYRIPGRLMLMAPVFQFGRLYRDKLERLDTLNSPIYFALVVAANVILHYTQGGLAFSAVWVGGFANGIWVPYVTVFTGIALWLRISKILAKRCNNVSLNRVIEFMGSHTFSICMLHLSAFFMVNVLLYKFGVDNIDLDQFKSNVYYAYLGYGGIFKLVYVAVGIAFPLGLSWVYEKLIGLKKTNN